MSRREARRRRDVRRQLWWGAVAILAAAGVAAVVIGLLGGAHGSAGAVAEDMSGAAVAFEPGVTPPPVSQSHAVADVGQRFAVPAKGLDVPLGSLVSVDGEVTPPGFTSAYVVTDHSVPLDRAADGTVVVAMHALNGGHAPGNALVDPASGAAAVSAGDLIEVGADTYRVTDTRRVAKPDLAGDAAIWHPEPGRLVVLTCFPRDGGAALDNLVVIGQLVSAQP